MVFTACVSDYFALRTTVLLLPFSILQNWMSYSCHILNCKISLTLHTRFLSPFWLTPPTHTHIYSTQCNHTSANISLTIYMHYLISVFNWHWQRCRLLRCQTGIQRLQANWRYLLPNLSLLLTSSLLIPSTPTSKEKSKNECTRKIHVMG